MIPDGNFAFMLPFTFATLGTTMLLASLWGSKAARLWGTGYLLASAGFVVPWAIPFGILPVPVFALCADALFTLAGFLYSEALFSHFGAPRFRWLRSIIALAGLAGAAVAVLVLDSLRLEVVSGDTAFAVLLFSPVPFVWRKARSRTHRFLLFMVTLVAAENILRNVIVRALDPADLGIVDFSGSHYAQAVQVSGASLGLILALTVLATVVSEVIETFRSAAEHDPLTGLINRRGFDRAYARSSRDGAILIADVDGFKAINDRYGHVAGDRVLVECARVLEESAPENAAVARFGGEEFVIHLPGSTTGEAAAIAEAMRRALMSRDWRHAGIEEQVTASFGLSELRARHGLGDALEAADRALYAAKRGGRNRVTTADSLPDSAPVRPKPKLRVVTR